jgi:hypothetical protein
MFPDVLSKLPIDIPITIGISAVCTLFMNILKEKFSIPPTAIWIAILLMAALLSGLTYNWILRETVISTVLCWIGSVGGWSSAKMLVSKVGNDK